MAKQGMKHYYTKREKNDAPPVPTLQGPAKSGKKQARPLIPGAGGKVFHTGPYGDNDLAADNLREEFDLTAADLQDLEG